MSDTLQQAKQRGNELLAKRKFGPALEQFQRVVAAAPDDLLARQKVAEVLVCLGKKAEAIDTYAGVCEAYARAGRLLQAIALSKTILKLDGQHTRTQALLAELYAQSSRPLELPTGPGPTLKELSGELPTPVLEAELVEPLDPSSLRAEPSGPDTSGEGEEEVLVGVEIVEPITAKLPQPDKLPEFPLFSALKRDDFIAVLNGAVEVRTFEAGQIIVKEGDVGDGMYAIVQGQVGVERELPTGTRRVDLMVPGDTFGEVALITRARRMATIRAETPVVALRFEKAALDAVLDRHPGVVLALDTFYRDRLLANWLRASPLFRPLDAAERGRIKKRFQPRAVEAGDVLVQHGQAGDGIFLLLRGTCEALGPSGEKVGDLAEGDSFGEISVIRQMPATATVRAVTAGLVVRLHFDATLKKVLEHPAVKPLVDQVIAERLQRTSDLELAAKR